MLCLNCRSELNGPYCHQCGQKDEPRIQPFRNLMGETFSETFSVDGRLMRTLNLLFRRPGFLTNEYIAGRRVSQVPPFRLYLLLSVLYFIVLAATGFDTFFFVGASPGSLAAQYLGLLPKLMFVILPAVALLLKLLYPTRLYVEHWVTSLHLHAVTFVLLTFHTLLLNWEIRGWARLLLIFAVDLPLQVVVFAYLFLTLRRVYGGSRPITFGKMLLLILGYLVVLTAVGALVINVDRLV